MRYVSNRWPSILRPSQPTLAATQPVVCYHPHPLSPFIIVTQPVSWSSLNYPMEDGRLSRPKHCSKGVQSIPNAVYHSVFVYGF